MANEHPVSSKHVSAILLMGGTGVRFGSTQPKQFHRISGKKVYLHTLETFIRSRFFHEILLVCPKEWKTEVEKDTQTYSGIPIRVLEGGETRQSSSFLGLKQCAQSTEYVVIHDAVRPFVTNRILKENVEGAIKYKAVDTCIPSADTLVHSLDQKEISAIPKRAQYLRGQTPQSFSYPLILKAHHEFQGQNASDDCSLVLKLNQPVHVIPGDEHNIKITTELDLFIAEQLFRLTSKEISEYLPLYSLKGKKFIITGGTGGIGKAVADLLEKEGAMPLLISRSAKHYPTDLTSYHNVEAIFQRINQEFGAVDGLINCVGQFKVKDLNALSPQEIESQLAVNLTSLIFCCKYAPIREGGHIINIASSSYSKGRKEYPIYSSAKAAVVNFTQALSDERSTLKINVIVPQRTNTPMRTQEYPNEPVTELLQPQEVASSIIELLKTDVTGTILEVRKKNET